MAGEWKPPDASSVTGPPADNSIIGHVIQRLFDIARPPMVSLSLAGAGWTARSHFCLDLLLLQTTAWQRIL